MALIHAVREWAILWYRHKIGWNIYSYPRKQNRSKWKSKLFFFLILKWRIPQVLTLFTLNSRSMKLQSKRENSSEIFLPKHKSKIIYNSTHGTQFNCESFLLYWQFSRTWISWKIHEPLFSAAIRNNIGWSWCFLTCIKEIILIEKSRCCRGLIDRSKQHKFEATHTHAISENRLSQTKQHNFRK